MSEFEIIRRQEYKRNRKKWMIIQCVAIALLAAISLGFFLGYNRINRTHYIEYKEAGSINYRVHYSDNEFFDSDWIAKDQSYISSLVEEISADFTYKLNTESDELKSNYSYSIDAKLEVASKDKGTPYYTVKENLVPKSSGSSEQGKTIRIAETVNIDYKHFNEIATSFVNTYNLKNSSSTLTVTLNVEILNSNTKFQQETRNIYTTSLNIPLASDTFNIHRTSGSADNDVKILEYKSVANRTALLIVAIAALSLAGLLGIVLLVFMQLTSNEDITYAARIRKILKSYSSYIQRIDGEFDCEGYQIVMIKTFTELLGIRDTIQSPILASENKDETMTQFLIPTNTSILYIYEVKVDNYDEIYSAVENAMDTPQVEQEPEVEQIIENTVILEEVDPEELAEAIAQPEVVLNEIEFVPNDDVEVAPEEPGIEVVGVVWPERRKNNKVYRYDPNGEILNEGDIVLAPTWDQAKGRDVIRKVAVAQGNYRVDPESIKHPLKKIIAVIKRKVATSLTPNANEQETEKKTRAKSK